MKPTIYNTTVPVTSQEMADRLLNVCKEYGLPYWDDDLAFDFESANYFNNGCCFGAFDYQNQEFDNDFFLGSGLEFQGFTLITESEWMELLKNTEL